MLHLRAFPENSIVHIKTFHFVSSCSYHVYSDYFYCSVGWQKQDYYSIISHIHRYQINTRKLFDCLECNIGISTCYIFITALMVPYLFPPICEDDLQRNFPDCCCAPFQMIIYPLVCSSISLSAVRFDNQNIDYTVYPLLSGKTAMAIKCLKKFKECYYWFFIKIEKV